MSKAQIKLLNFAAISCFKKIFDVSCTDTAMERMKMFDCCEVSDVPVRRKMNFLQRYARSDSILCLRVFWLETCPCLATYVVHCLSDFVTCISLICVCPFYFCLNIPLPFNGEIKMCV